MTKNIAPALKDRLLQMFYRCRLLNEKGHIFCIIDYRHKAVKIAPRNSTPIKTTTTTKIVLITSSRMPGPRRGNKKKNGAERARKTAQEARERIGLRRHWALIPETVNNAPPAALEGGGYGPSRATPNLPPRPAAKSAGGNDTPATAKTSRPAAQRAGGNNTLTTVNKLLSRPAAQRAGGNNPTPSPAAKSAGGEKTLAEVNSSRQTERLPPLYQSATKGRCGVRHYLARGSRADLVCLHEVRRKKQGEQDEEREERWERNAERKAKRRRLA